MNHCPQNSLTLRLFRLSRYFPGAARVKFRKSYKKGGKTRLFIALISFKAFHPAAACHFAQTNRPPSSDRPAKPADQLKAPGAHAANPEAVF